MFVTISAVTPKVHIGNIQKNLKEMSYHISKLESICPDIIVFPELSLTGYTCADLFSNSEIINSVHQTIFQSNIVTAKSINFILIFGAPIMYKNSLYNCAIVCKIDQSFSCSVIGIVPKTYLPNYKEFYEDRWFARGTDLPFETDFIEGIPFGCNLLFRQKDVIIGVEICEDLWTPIPPSSFQSLAGANILINLSASNELVGKSDYRKSLVLNQSARCVSSYVYCSSGVHESTADLVFGGHSIIAENGSLLTESKKFNRDGSEITTTIDIEKLNLERIKLGSFAQSKSLLGNRKYNYIDIPFRLAKSVFTFGAIGSRFIDPLPFVPKDSAVLSERCSDIFEIQIAGLAKRVESSKTKKINIGISGGLDSTLALLVAVKMCDKLNLPRNFICGITMPGFGTSDRTKSNAIKLMELFGIETHEVNISQMTFDLLKEIKDYKPFGIDISKLSLKEFIDELKSYKGNLYDPVFENAQARARTLVLMTHGFVLGTGDLSELALGWCTYNGDHMSMYNVNCSVPKTLVKFLVYWVKCNMEFASNNHLISDEIKRTLEDILNTEISPELLPIQDGKIQNTEDSIGPYELHDFFLFNFVRNGFDFTKIQTLAEIAFNNKYNKEEIYKHLTSFIKRFFSNQFKRDCVPNGPKVGSVSLSPRGDWRMPPDMDFSSIL